MKQYIVDAFTDKVFAGNQAAVCVLDAWPSQQRMIDIAVENNLSETAFTVKEGDRYRLRWFTPGGEIDLCGHATLATAYVLFRFYNRSADRVAFETLSGPLLVERRGDRYEMDFPVYAHRPVPVTDAMEDALGVRPVEAYLDRDLLLVLDSGEAVRTLTPDLEKLKALDGLLHAVTARGEGEYDCVSRVFAPKLNVPEDPVTGSAHCMIVPYWAEKLGKDEISAFQASRRAGALLCRVAGERVKQAGKAALFSVAEILLDGEG